MRFILFEIFQILKNKMTLIAFALILFMYITQCLPEKWYWYAKPMDEMHFFYKSMLDDYSRGHTYKIKIDGMTIFNKIQLTDEDKQFILSTIKKMNPQYEKNEVYDKEFSFTQTEFETALNDLSDNIGYENYYGDAKRPIYYNYYKTKTFNVKSSLKDSEKITAMDDYINFVLNQNRYTQYSQLFVKKIKLSANSIKFISKIKDNIEDAKKYEMDDSQLYELYDHEFIEIDKQLGENTAFGTKYRRYVFNLSNTLETEIEHFESIKNNEKVTNAYARYYSDYMTILAGILPAIFGAFTLIEDRRHKMQEYVYSSKIPSSIYVASKYIAIVIIFALCFYIISLISTILFSKFAHTYDLDIDIFAFFKYTTFWVMPTVLFTTALSMFLSVVLMNGILPIVIQLIIFFMSALPLIGDYKLYRPVIRYNEIGNFEFFRNSFNDIIFNRIFISIASLIIVLLTIYIYELIRKNESFVDKLFIVIVNKKGR